MHRLTALCLLAPLLPATPLAAAPAIEVTRFHLLAPPAPPISGQTIAIQPPADAGADSLAFAALSQAASAALAKAGFQPVPAGQPAVLNAVVTLSGETRTEQRRSPISIGIGGGTGGWGGGVGGGLSFPLGGGTRTVTLAQMFLQIRRSADNQALWEGRASTPVKGASPNPAAPALLTALLKGFPGPSGQSVKVK